MSWPYHCITCDEKRGCDPSCNARRFLGLPRDPDLSEHVPGQVDLLALLEETD